MSKELKKKKIGIKKIIESERKKKKKTNSSPRLSSINRSTRAPE